METLWKQFIRLSGGRDTGKDHSGVALCDWNAAFTVLLEITKNGRNANPDFARTFSELNEMGVGCCEVDFWLEAYLDELDMQGQYVQLQGVCEKLLDLYQWEEDGLTDLYMRLVNALTAQEKHAEAVVFCEDWYKKEQEGQKKCVAAAILIYAKIAARDLSGARKVADQFISDDVESTAENEMVLQAATLLHEIEESKEVAWSGDEVFSDYYFDGERFLAEMFA